MLNTPVYVNRAVEVFDDVQGLLRGYVFIWGSPNGENGVGRDSYETWFDQSRGVNFSANGELRGYPICLEHGMDETAGKGAVGSIVRTWFDDTGLAFEAQLDRSHPLFERTVARTREGFYKTSSSSAEHMADFYEDGAFRNWMMTELSLVEHPAQAEIPPVTLVRSSAEGQRDADRDDTSTDDTHSIATPDELETRMFNQVPAPAAPPIPEAREDAVSVEAAVAQMVEMYGVEAVQAAIAQLAAPAEAPTMESAPAEFPRSADFMARLKATLDANKSAATIKKLQDERDAVRAQLALAQAAPPAADPTRAVNPQVSVSEPRKFWGRSTNDLLLAHQLINSREFRAQGIRQSDEFLNVVAGRAADELAKGDKSKQFSDLTVRSAIRGTRANEIATSTAAGGGDEWVGVAYSTNLWEKARNNRVYEELVARGMMVEEIQQGFESVYIPTEGADPTVYTISQPTDIDATSRPTVNVATTRIGTGRVLLTPGELGMAVAYTDVFDEDSLIRVAPQYNRQMEEKAAETIEQLFWNGDSATSANVNYDGGTPGTGLATPYYIASNGARKYALVTGSGTSRSAGTLDENDFRLTLKLMASAIRTRKQQMVFGIDPDTHNTALDIAAIKTDDVRRTNATITSGMLTNIYGVDVLESGFIPSADTDGKVTYNGNVAETGSIILVYAPYWAVATKRQITVETDRDILSGTNIIVAKMRIGFAARGAGAAVASYNVTIA